jgi:hypothetical protein
MPDLYSAYVTNPWQNVAKEIDRSVTRILGFVAAVWAGIMGLTAGMIAVGSGMGAVITIGSLAFTGCIAVITVIIVLVAAIVPLIFLFL